MPESDLPCAVALEIGGARRAEHTDEEGDMRRRLCATSLIGESFAKLSTPRSSASALNPVSPPSLHNHLPSRQARTIFWGRRWPRAGVGVKRPELQTLDSTACGRRVRE